jgi:hypothetical protein
MAGTSIWEDLDQATGRRGKQLAELKRLYQRYQEADRDGMRDSVRALLGALREDVRKRLLLAMEIADKTGSMLLDRDDAARVRGRRRRRAAAPVRSFNRLGKVG